MNIVNDFQRGKLPFFVAPPLSEGETPTTVAAEPMVKATFDNAQENMAEGTDGMNAEAQAGCNDAIKGKGKGKKERVWTREELEAMKDLAAIEAEEAARVGIVDGENDSDDGDNNAEYEEGDRKLQLQSRDDDISKGETNPDVKKRTDEAMASNSEPSVEERGTNHSVRKKRKVTPDTARVKKSTNGEEQELRLEESASKRSRNKQSVGTKWERDGQAETDQKMRNKKKSKRNAIEMSSDGQEGGTEDEACVEEMTAGTGAFAKKRRQDGDIQERHHDADRTEKDGDEDEAAIPSIEDSLQWDDLS